MRRPRRRRRPPLALLAAIGFAALVFPVFTAANSVPATRAADVTRPITPDDLKPPACSGISLTNVVVGSTGTGQNDLLLGSPGLDNMNGRSGDDCILGGAGIDRISGAQGTDVCLGGPDPDVLSRSCETAVD